jgi:hypothetical protein
VLAVVVILRPKDMTHVWGIYRGRSLRAAVMALKNHIPCEVKHESKASRDLPRWYSDKERGGIYGMWIEGKQRQRRQEGREGEMTGRRIPRTRERASLYMIFNDTRFERAYSMRRLKRLARREDRRWQNKLLAMETELSD